MKIIDNTTNPQVLLKEFIDNPPRDKLELFHQMLMLSVVYDFIIDDKQIIVCDKEKG